MDDRQRGFAGDRLRAHRSARRSSLGAVLPYTPFFGLALLIVFVLNFGGPIAVILTGFGKRQWPMVAGGFASLLLLAAASVVSDWLDMRRLTHSVAALDMRTFAQPQSSPAILVLEYSRNTDCDQLCQLILVNSDYAVAVGGISAQRVVYRKIGHAECHETEYVSHNVQFFGICATTDTVDRIDDALLIVTPMNLEAWDEFPGLGYEFSGKAFALIERREGQNHLLGRWISGRAKSAWFESDSIGADFTREEFYRAALGMRLRIEDLQNATWFWEAR
jgi:hypothetical protein